MHENDESAAARQTFRCELVPVPPKQKATWWPTKGKPTPPPLVLDVDIKGTIRVFDANTDALIAKARLAQVTATPAKYRRVDGDENNPGATYMQPLLILDIPDEEPLRIGAYRVGGTWGTHFRYGWRDRVPAENETAYNETAYVVTEAEWLTLVQKFGLGNVVVDDHASGKIARQSRYQMVKIFASFALFLILLAVVAANRHFHYFK